jgi:predicted DNA-binding protein (MmcQ/YjbR family)
MSQSPLLTRMRRICLALPDTEESSRLGGSPHFYVRGKIFAGCGDEGGTSGFGVKVGLELQSLLVQRPGIEVAKYVGRYGWVRVAESALQDDDELERLIHLSYRLIGGDAAGAEAAPASRRRAKAAGAKRNAAKAAAASKPRSAAKRKPRKAAARPRASGRRTKRAR